MSSPPGITTRTGQDAWDGSGTWCSRMRIRWRTRWTRLEASAAGLRALAAYVAFTRLAHPGRYPTCLMDAVEPALVNRAERTLRRTPGVLDVGQVRLRWIGPQLRAECEVMVAGAVTVVEAHQSRSRPSTTCSMPCPGCAGALVHADPQPQPGADHHAMLAPHR